MVRKSSTKAVSFKLSAPSAKKVSVVGSFNNWDIKANSARKDPSGNWSAKMSLKPGRYEYKFFVDGQWWNDPKGSCRTTNSFGSQNNILEVK